MSKVLEEFSFKFSSKSKYPWDEWSDGRIYEIKKGIDFNCSVTGMQSQIRMRARSTSKENDQVRVSIGEDDTIVFQFYKQQGEHIGT